MSLITVPAMANLHLLVQPLSQYFPNYSSAFVFDDNRVDIPSSDKINQQFVLKMGVRLVVKHTIGRL